MSSVLNKKEIFLKAYDELKKVDQKLQGEGNPPMRIAFIEDGKIKVFITDDVEIGKTLDEMYEELK